MPFSIQILINNYMKKDYIYIIINDLGYVKIGVSKNPNQRLKQLQTGNQSKLSLLFTEEFECDRKHLLDIENYIHKNCSYLCKRVKGEWFNIEQDNIEDLCRFVTYCRIRYEDDITFGRNKCR